MMMLMKENASCERANFQVIQQIIDLCLRGVAVDATLSLPMRVGWSRYINLSQYNLREAILVKRRRDTP